MKYVVHWMQDGNLEMKYEGRSKRKAYKLFTDAPGSATYVKVHNPVVVWLQSLLQRFLKKCGKWRLILISDLIKMLCQVLTMLVLCHFWSNEQWRNAAMFGLIYITVDPACMLRSFT